MGPARQSLLSTAGARAYVSGTPFPSSSNMTSEEGGRCPPRHSRPGAVPSDEVALDGRKATLSALPGQILGQHVVRCRHYWCPICPRHHLRCLALRAAATSPISSSIVSRLIHISTNSNP